MAFKCGLVVAVTMMLLSYAQSQSDCRFSIIALAATNTGTIDMRCPVDVDVDVVISDPSEFRWKWQKITHDDRILEIITNNLMEERNESVYTLNSVQCNDSGLYRAIYTNQTDTCLFHCNFILQEVSEVRLDVLRTAFSRYPTFDGTVSSNLTGRESTSHRVGTCGEKIFLDSLCVVRVSSIWYRNGTLFDPNTDKENYTVLSSGELLISNLTSSIVGFYVCVTTVSGLENSYVTVQTNVVLSPPTLGPLTTDRHTPTTTELEGNGENITRRLTAWQIGLVIGAATLLITAVLMAGVVCMGHLTIKRRRDMRKQGQVKYTAAKKVRPRSMMEQIQMLEENEEENVDFEGPVDVPFNCILFEELLHKGTFKVVHHGVVNQPSQGVLSVPVAVKRLKDEKSELGYEELMSEAYVLRAMQEKSESHPNVASLFGLTTQGGPTCLLIEYVPNGTLEKFLESLKLGPIPEWYLSFVQDTLRGAYHKHISGDLMNIIVQVAEGMKFLTDQGFIHRDLSTRNILMGERLNIKIINAGMHHEGYYYSVTERKHFLQDMAPECLWEKCYSTYSDVWSFGILAYRTVTLNSIPFPDMEVNTLHGRLVGGERPQLLTSFSNELYFLLQRCWQFVATERPHFSTILSDLTHMAEKPTRHILLKASKEQGYISENGQVFLSALPPYVLEENNALHKKSKRNSGTVRSLISSIDDTVYTRDTVETVLDFTPSENENENYNNYEEYLKGDLSIPLSKRAEKRRSLDETDTSGNDVNSNTREWVKGTIKKVDSGGGDSRDGGAGIKGTSSKKKKRRTPSNGNRERKKSGTTTSAREKGINKVSASGFAFSSLSTSPPAPPPADDAEMSTDDAPSITEEEKVGTSDVSGSGSDVELVRL